MDADKSLSALEAISKETVDLENMPIEEVLEKLNCTTAGLTSDEVQERLEVFGYNKLEEKKESKILKFLGDPKEAQTGITEVHFLSFNPIDKRTTLTYIDGAGNMHRVSKGAPEQIEIKKKVAASEDASELIANGKSHGREWLKGRHGKTASLASVSAPVVAWTGGSLIIMELGFKTLVIFFRMF